jgi:hypothetical protein
MDNYYSQSGLKSRFSSETTLSAQPSTASKRSSASAKSNLVKHPVAINIPGSAYWVCNACDAPNKFEGPFARHPLGQLKCIVCYTVANMNLETINFPQLTGLPGTEYKLSIPSYITYPYPPRTVFVWACCNAGCGRSYQQFATDVIRCCTSEPSLTSIKKSMLHRIQHALRYSNSAGSASKTEDPIIHDTNSERRLYVVKFDATCVCTHKSCETCFRGTVSRQEEWVVRVQDVLGG